MTTVHTGSRALILHTKGTPNSASHGTPTLKLPDVEDIDDLVTRIQETTDTLSRLLLRVSGWRRNLSSEQRRLLESNVGRFCNLCEHVAALLQTFYDFSQDFATLFASVLEPESYPSIEEFASSLWSEMPTISTQVIEVEERYKSFASRFRDLMYIAPRSIPRHPQDLDRVLQRLDAFWKVAATYIVAVLEGRVDLPHASLCHDARNKWTEYKGYLSGAMDVLKEASDALEVASGSQSANLRNTSGVRAKLSDKQGEPIIYRGQQIIAYDNHHWPTRLKKKGGAKGRTSFETGAEDFKRGFAAFWSRLTQRQASRPAIGYSSTTQSHYSASSEHHFGPGSPPRRDERVAGRTLPQQGYANKVLPSLPVVSTKIQSTPACTDPRCSCPHLSANPPDHKATTQPSNSAAGGIRAEPARSATLILAMQPEETRNSAQASSPNAHPQYNWKYLMNPVQLEMEKQSTSSASRSYWQSNPSASDPPGKRASAVTGKSGKGQQLMGADTETDTGVKNPSRRETL